ncbi:undecaprenyl-diphosphatase [Treponema bryantii]|uniref:Undecaprenyl-diphosphatase n=1 Tax=Treponema bryantii TaxID=163 RepID=A0A1I3M682_9SPIR|nr:phosphatase PAP2 family protein [Treponema bryantii]SFI92340.1 undecaprenyl-diphosphatase [Treponema bryantii]
MKKYCSAIFWGICFIIFTVLVKFVDVQPVGAEASLIGFANLNTAVFQLLGTNDFCYRLTQCLGIVAIATAARYAIDGFIQLIKRKSLFKVDREILMVGIIYAIVIILYVLFEKLAINYRPIITDEGLEASYPSTHTMLILTVFGTAIPLAGKYIKNPKTATLEKICLIIFMWVTVVCRLLSGVHWFTDIIGGLLISLALISLYKALRN